MAAEVGFANVDLDSAGDPSDPDSDIVAVTYDGPATVFTSFEFSGILSAVIGDTSEEEAFLQVTVTGVPEPSGLILLVAALVSVAGRRRFRC